jgi:Na+-driven multidrug efflux pump
MRYSTLKRIEKIKKLLEYIAYGSLGFDAGIAVVTLVSVHLYAKELDLVLKYLNYGLTAVVLLSVFLFLVLLFMSHYEKMIESFLELRFKMKAKKKE